MRPGVWRVAAIAMTSGLLLGAAGRVVMRFVALESGLTPGATAGGTLDVILFGLIVGAPVTLAFVLIGGGRPLPVWTGLACGLLVFGALAVLPPPAARSALAETPDTPAATAAAFVLLFLAWGAALAVFRRWLWHGFPSTGSTCSPGRRPGKANTVTSEAKPYPAQHARRSEAEPR